VTFTPSGMSEQIQGTDPASGNVYIYQINMTLDDMLGWIISNSPGASEYANGQTLGATILQKYTGIPFTSDAVYGTLAYIVALAETYGIVDTSVAPIPGGYFSPEANNTYFSVTPLVLDDVINQVYTGWPNVPGALTISQFDTDTQTWLPQTSSSGLSNFEMPTNTSILFGDTQKGQVQSQLEGQNIIVPEAEYLVLPDEPQVDGSDVINLQTQMSSSQWSDLMTLFSQMPRSYLQNWFTTNVLPNLPTGSVVVGGGLNWTPTTLTLTQVGETSIANEVYLAFIHAFNTANINYLSNQGTALTIPNFWAWEQTKLENLYASQAADTQSAFLVEIDQYLTANLPADPQAQNLIDQYSQLPPIGDPGLEISRQNAVNQLLIQGEYTSVQGIIDSYSYVDTTVLSTIVKSPIPSNVVTPSGIVVATPPAQTT